MSNKNTTNGYFLATNESAKKQKDVKKVKKNKKPNIFKRIGAKLKDVFSELKKVSWPSFAKVVKQTGIVLVVVLVFLVVIAAFDTGLYSLLGLVKDLPPIF
jgi:preprotein translocase SecE subunit